MWSTPQYPSANWSRDTHTRTHTCAYTLALPVQFQPVPNIIYIYI
uniref:Uncharacterized protein n=1 Tax=Anguilla anguilla TaxID=7936 RepID=A0A0E9R6W4_ANGAN